MKTEKIREGKVRLYVPKGRIYDASVFYNREGEMNRDISVSALQVFQKEFGKRISVCDALSASGVRGLRYAKEVSGIKQVVLNDNNPMAAKLIKKNIKENRLEKKCKATKNDANMTLRKNVFLVIDIDPFGSPCTFMDSAARSIYHKGFLAVTATDQSALAGTYPDSCMRKYGIKTIKTDFYNELGTRILISFVMLKLLREFKYVSYCSCGNWKVGCAEKCDCGKGFKLIGPIFMGNISEKNFCKGVLSDIRKRKFDLKKQEEKLLGTLIEESEMPPFYFDLHSLAKSLKKQIPRTERFIALLKKKGFEASRTHFSPTAVKTNASFKIIAKLLDH